MVFEVVFFFVSLSALGAWLFAESPDMYTWIGAAIVFGSSLYIAWRESVVRKEKRAAGTDKS